MPAKEQHTTAAANYAQAMLDLANERQQADDIGEELNQLADVVASDPNFALFLRDPAIGHAERHRVVEQAFSGRVSPLVMNFLGVLNSKGRLSLLVPIARTYQQLLDRQAGRIQVDVTVAQPLDEQTQEMVRQRVGRALNKTAILRQHVDESIIGGLVVQVGDKLMDASVKSQLESMKRKLLAAVPR